MEPACSSFEKKIKDLPSTLIWKHVLPFIPCFHLTPSILRRQLLVLRCFWILKFAIQGLSKTQRRHIHYYLRGNTFLEDIFEYESDELYLALYPLATFGSDPDYVVIWK
jgi:hypothetical protein